MASHDLRERIIRLRFEMTGVSVGNVASIQGLSSYYLTHFDGFLRHKCPLGSRKFKDAYNKAPRLEQETTLGLNNLLEKLLSWVTDTDGRGLPDDAFPDVNTLKQLCELWEKERYSVQTALATLKNEPAPRLASTRFRSLKRWANG
jgi:hypothetical protein